MHVVRTVVIFLLSSFTTRIQHTNTFYYIIILAALQYVKS